MAARAIAGLIVIGLALGIWMLWPRGDPVSNTTTTVDVVAVPTTVASTTPNTSSSTSTTIGPDDHIVETVEEAEAILRELWFGWFEGIYNEDEDRIREVVATEDLVEAAKTQFVTMQFLEIPEFSGVLIESTEILRADADCLSVWTKVSATFREGTSTGVEILRRIDDRWKLISAWVNRGDLWDADCDSELQPLP